MEEDVHGERMRFMLHIDLEYFTCNTVDEHINMATFNALLSDVPSFLESLSQFDSFELITGAKREISQKLSSIARFIACNRTNLQYESLETFPYLEIIEIIAISIDREHWHQVTIAALECLINVLCVDRDPPVDNIMESPLTDILLSCVTQESPFQGYLVKLMANLMSLSTELNDFFCDHGFIDCVRASLSLPFTAPAVCASLRSISAEKISIFVELLNELLTLDQFNHTMIIDSFRGLLIRFGEDAVDISAIVEHIREWLDDTSNNIRTNATLAFIEVLETPPEDVFEKVENLLKDVCDILTHKRALKLLIKFSEHWKGRVSEDLIGIITEYAHVQPYETAVLCVQALTLYAANVTSVENQLELMDLYLDYISESKISSECMSAVRDLLESLAKSELLEMALPLMEPVIDEIKDAAVNGSEDAGAIIDMLLE